MRVQRIYEKEVKHLQEGDRIKVGKYTATAVKADGEYMIFCLDQYLDKPYTHRDLLYHLNCDLGRDKNFAEIRKAAVPFDLSTQFQKKSIDQCMFRVPYAGEFFSGTYEDEWIHSHYEPDIDGEFLDIWECMKNRRNRIADRAGEEYEWGWLMNPVKGQEVVSAANFAVASGYGFACTNCASNSYGVRPVFRLVR